MPGSAESRAHHPGGRVGTALGMALERAEHVVVACSAISEASRRLTERRLPDTPIMPVPDVADSAELLLLTVSTPNFPAWSTARAATGAVRRGTIVCRFRRQRHRLRLHRSGLPPAGHSSRHDVHRHR